MSTCEMRLAATAARRDASRAAEEARLAIENDLRRLAGLAPVVAPPVPLRLAGLAPVVAPPVPSTIDTAPPGLYCRAVRQLATWLLPAEAEAQTPRATPPPPARTPVPQYVTPGAGIGEEQRLRDARGRAATYEVEIQKKYAIATACLVFALVGVPVALRFQRGGVGLVIGVSVAVFAVYYVGLIVGEDLGDQLVVSPFLAMWTPNLIFAAAGVFGLWRIRKPGNAPHGGLERRRRGAAASGELARFLAPARVAQPSVSTLDRYVLREWTKVCLLAALGFPFLVIVIDLADKFETYFGRGLSKARVAYSYLFFLPETISLVLPVAVLFAVVFTVGALGRHSELTAAKASGMSFHRVVRPLLLASLAVVLLDLGLTELAPGASARRAELLGEKTARPTSSRFSPFVYRADSGWVYSIRSLELRANGAEMRDPIMERGGTGEEYPTILVAAQRATYDTARAKRGWTLTKGAVRYLLGPGREPTFKFDSLRVTTLRETPTALLAEPKAPDEMRYAELGRYVDALARSGSDTRKLRVEQALKLTVPFACIIVALFGAPLAISTPRSGMAWGVAVCLATTFVDLLMFQLSKAVGQGGALPPTFAAWVPNLLFGAAGVWLWRKART